MSDQDSAKDVIESYRKRQNQGWQSIALFIGTALLIILGAALVIFWLTGAELNVGQMFASKTPTPSQTPTATPVTPTATVTLTPTPAAPTDTPPPSPTPTRSGAVIYIAEEEDTFSSIAERFDMDVFTLLVYNQDRLDLDLANPVLFVGDEVLIPAPGAEVPTPTPIPFDVLPGFRVEYMVRPGDSLGSIANKLRSTVEDILEYNEDLEDPNAIYPGQILIVRVNLVTPVPTEETQETPQRTPGSISTLTPTPSQ
jgi:LysM repeat protein